MSTKKHLKRLLSYFYFNQRTSEMLVWLANIVLKRDGHDHVNIR